MHNPVRKFMSSNGFTYETLATATDLTVEIIKQAEGGTLSELPSSLTIFMEQSGICQAQAEYTTWLDKPPYFCGGHNKQLPASMEMMRLEEMWSQQVSHSSAITPDSEGDYGGKPPHDCGRNQPVPEDFGV